MRMLKVKKSKKTNLDGRTDRQTDTQTGMVLVFWSGTPYFGLD